MAKSLASTTEIRVRDARSGQLVTVHGVGALKGQLQLKKSIDLTKPIAAQAMGGSSGRKRATAQAKH